MFTKICIICKEHGEFWQTPHNHLKGYGCKKCSIEKNKLNLFKTAEQFLKECKLIHRR